VSWTVSTENAATWTAGSTDPSWTDLAGGNGYVSQGYVTKGYVRLPWPENSDDVESWTGSSGDTETWTEQ
jgi:hypothetical protein